MTTLSPQQIVQELDRYIIGQAAAKRAVAVAVRNRWRRQQLAEGIRKDVSPKNILLIGPTGVGKTEIARRLATLTGSPFVKVEATKFTEVGYHGRDVESMVRDLLDVAIGMVQTELHAGVREQAAAGVEERLLDQLLPASSARSSAEPDAASRTREKLRTQLRAGELESQMVEITVDNKPNVAGLLGPAGLQLDTEMESMFERMLPSRRETRKLTIADARRLLATQEAEQLVDRNELTAEAIRRTEQLGIIFLDEIDKIASSGKADGPDVSRQGVQRDLLPIVEGSTVVTKHGHVKTDHVLFIAAGAFHNAKPSDLMPELQGRFPIRVELADLTRNDLVRILKEPANSLIAQAVALLGTEGLQVRFTDDAIDRIAQLAFDTNRKAQNIGARRLYTILERVLEELSFAAPDMQGQQVTIDARYVNQRLDELLKEEGRSRFIL